MFLFNLPLCHFKEMDDAKDRFTDLVTQMIKLKGFQCTIYMSMEKYW